MGDGMDCYMELIGNSGVYLDFGEHAVCVDGIFQKGRCFSDMPMEMKRAIFGMNSRYANATCLLFTHRHIDHFFVSGVNQYVSHNDVSHVLVPCGDPKHWDEMDSQGDLENDWLYLGKEKEPFQKTLWEGCRFFGYPTVHMGGNLYAHSHHHTICLEVAGKSFVFAADADCVWENFWWCQNKKIDVLCINPLFLQHQMGRQIIEQLDIEYVVVYHIPFGEDDTSGLCEVAKGALEQYPAEQKIIVFSEEGQRFLVK